MGLASLKKRIQRVNKPFTMFQKDQIFTEAVCLEMNVEVVFLNSPTYGIAYNCVTWMW